MNVVIFAKKNLNIIWDLLKREEQRTLHRYHVFSCEQHLEEIIKACQQTLFGTSYWLVVYDMNGNEIRNTWKAHIELN